MEIRTNNNSYKNRNKNKIKTLIGTDEVFRDILSLEFEADGKPVSMKELFEKIYNDKNELDAELESAKNEIKKLQDDNTRLRKALSEYINKENTVDSALTASVELLSHQLQNALDEISKLKDKTKYL